jgi:acetyl esterase/lipase
MGRGRDSPPGLSPVVGSGAGGGGLMIPRAQLFGGAEVATCRLSPDGQHLAWLAPVDSALELCVAPAQGPVRAPAGRTVLTAVGGVRSYTWVGRRLVYAWDRGGDEDFQLCAIDLTGGAATELTAAGASARIYATSPDAPDRVAIGLNDRDPRWHDVHVIDLATGARVQVLRNDDRLFGFVFDRRLVPRMALRAEPEGRTIVELIDGRAVAWRGIAAEDELATWLIGFDRDGDTLYWVGSEGGDTATLRAQRLTAPTPTVIAAHPDADVVRVVCDPVTGAPIAACVDPLVPVWMPCGPGGEHVTWLAGEIGHSFEVVSQTDDGRAWLVARDSPAQPMTYDRFEPPRGLGPSLASRPSLAAARLASMRPAIVTARDGLALSTYLSLPDQALPDQALRGLPAVVWVHGGPWRRDEYCFDVRHQWLASRGYAVLSVNFRGSTGFGKRFVNAADHEWAGKMHLDLVDAIAALVAEGVIDPARVAIAGGSFGGYAALVGMTFTPELFACGVSICGPANLETSQANKPAYWAAAAEMRARRIGDPRTEAGRRLLAERSPVNRAHAIRRPLLVAHGANDPRVRREESDQIVAAAQRNGVAVSYLVYRDEGHGLARAPNALSFYAVMERFLAVHLGGQEEPLGDALAAANVEVVTGGELLGLTC